MKSSPMIREEARSYAHDIRERRSEYRSLVRWAFLRGCPLFFSKFQQKKVRKSVKNPCNPPHCGDIIKIDQDSPTTGRRKGMNKKEKRLLKKFFKTEQAKPTLSLREDKRTYCADDDYDGYVEFGFIPRDTFEWTDEAVKEWLREYVSIPYRHSQYDCTGQLFTAWIDWHRNPCGLISFVHRVSIDV